MFSITLPSSVSCHEVEEDPATLGAFGGTIIFA
jgi:hypothetical protein